MKDVHVSCGLSSFSACLPSLSITTLLITPQLSMNYLSVTFDYYCIERLYTYTTVSLRNFTTSYIYITTAACYNIRTMLRTMNINVRTLVFILLCASLLLLSALWRYIIVFHYFTLYILHTTLRLYCKMYWIIICIKFIKVFVALWSHYII